MLMPGFRILVFLHTTVSLKIIIVIINNKTILLGNVLFPSQLPEPGFFSFLITEYLTASSGGCGKIPVAAVRLQVKHRQSFEYNLAAEK